MITIACGRALACGLLVLTGCFLGVESPAAAQTTTAPNITSEGPFSVDEGDTAVAPLTADDDDTASGDPDAADSDGTYDVTVQVSDGSGTDSADLAVTLANLDETGTLTLGPGQPLVGAVSRARLSDPDGVTSVAWRWQRSTDRNTWTNISGANRESYKSVDSDAGMYLRARARYTDGHGPGKSLVVPFTDAVAEGEASPDLTVVTLISGLTIPWDIAFTPDGTMLFTQRSGMLSRLADGTVQPVTANFSDLFSFSPNPPIGRVEGAVSREAVV